MNEDVVSEGMGQNDDSSGSIVCTPQWHAEHSGEHVALDRNNRNIVLAHARTAGELFKRIDQMQLDTSQYMCTKLCELHPDEIEGQQTRTYGKSFENSNDVLAGAIGKMRYPFQNTIDDIEREQT